VQTSVPPAAQPQAVGLGHPERSCRETANRDNAIYGLAGSTIGDVHCQIRSSIGRIVRDARSRLRTLLPRAVELVYENYNALAIGFGPTERASDAVVSLAVYPRWVNLYFLHGATLPDPAHLVLGSGNQGRYLVLEAASDIDKPAVRTLIKAAVAGARIPMPKAGRGLHGDQIGLGASAVAPQGSWLGPHNRAARER
jgi:hypothetical protein